MNNNVQMYEFYMGKMLLPVAPSKLKIKVNNRNKTMDLLNGGEVNIVKSAGLITISYDALLPMYPYPFAKYKGKFKAPEYYLEKLKTFKAEKKKFYFKVNRILPNGSRSFDTDIKVTLEDYQITEDAKEGQDITVSISLKQHVAYGTKKYEIVSTLSTDSTTKVKKTSSRDSSSKEIPSTYTVKEKDSLWKICKKLLGDGSKCWNIAKLNNLSNPNLIYVGQVLKIKDVESSAANAAGYTSL